MDDKERVEEISIEDYQVGIEAIKKTKEVIGFAYQLEEAFKSGSIKASSLPPEMFVDGYHIKRDWTKSEQVLKEDFSNTCKINIVSHAITVLKKTYANMIGNQWVEKEGNPDLYAAQRILKLFRDTLGKMGAKKGKYDAAGDWKISGKDKDKFEIISIGVVLDTRSLDGEQFSWKQIGGLENFMKVLDYLEQDLHTRILTSSSVPKEKQESNSP